MRAIVEPDRTAFQAPWSPSPFVMLPENRSAVLAIRRLARSLGPAPRRCPFHLLLVHGPPGCGKSHLADWLMTRAAPHGTVLRQEAADWPAVEETASMEARDSGLLIIEDLQHLSAKATGAFSVVLDHRSARGRPTLLTANAGPAELERLPARLRSRLTAGLIVRIERPGNLSRRRLLYRLAERRRLNIRPEVVDWLAEHLSGSGRELLAALRQLETLAEAAGGPPDLATVSEVFIAANGSHSLTLERLAQRVSRFYRVEARSMRGRQRQPGLVWPRQVSMYLAREVAGISLARIGAFFGRDHSTVRHACERVSEEIIRNPKLASEVRELTTELAS